MIVELTGQESRFGAETSLPSAEAATWYKHGGTRQLLAATMASDNLQLVCGDLLQDHEASFVRTIYSAPVTEGEAKPEQQVTAVLPLSMERVALSLGEWRAHPSMVRMKYQAESSPFFRCYFHYLWQLRATWCLSRSRNL